MIVLDASMIISALFPDERQPVALAVYQMVLDREEEAIAPPIFPYEACNVVMQSLRRQRIDVKTGNDYLEIIYGIPLRVDLQQAMPNIVKLCAKHALTIYDAAYLELAKRLGLPLATLDGALAAAARREKVPLLA